MSSLDRIIDAIRKIIRSEFANYSYIGIYEYSIQSVSGSGDSDTTIDAEPVDTTLTLPPINNLALKPSITGATAKPVAGKLCYIMFVNGKPSKPICISCEGPADKVQIGTGPAVARVGDSVVAGPWAGNITTGSTKVTSM
jgi:hypothetical protein